MQVNVWSLRATVGVWVCRCVCTHVSACFNILGLAEWENVQRKVDDGYIKQLKNVRRR